MATPQQMAEKAIEVGQKLKGTRYGDGWSPGTWPAGPSLYSRYDRDLHTIPYVLNHEMICSAFINWLRGRIADLPAVGGAQGDAFPGGTAAIGRHLARAEGTRRYPPVENTPRGWLCFANYTGPNLAQQGHVGIALGDGRLLEARVPRLSDDRIEADVNDLMLAFGGAPFTRIIPPEVWLRK